MSGDIQWALQHSYWGDSPVGSTIWLGFFWALCGSWGVDIAVAFDWVKKDYGFNDWTQFAWDAMAYGLPAVFGPLFIIWLLAYIKTENHIMQKVYYYAITYLNIAAWALLLWINIDFIVGGFMEGGKIWNLVIAITLDVTFFVWQAIAFFVVKPRATKWYRWDEQDYYHGNSPYQWDNINEM